MTTDTAKFPAGGPRDPVYSFLQRNGWIMSKWSDKHWHQRGDLSLHLYGSGSQAKVMHGPEILYDGPLDGIVNAAMVGSEQTTKC